MIEEVTEASKTFQKIRANGNRRNNLREREGERVLRKYASSVSSTSRWAKLATYLPTYAVLQSFFRFPVDNILNFPFSTVCSNLPYLPT